MVKIFIDAGHGGSDPGSVANDLKEKNLTLEISKRIAALLNNYKNVQVKLSRTGDQTLSLKQRTDMANTWGADYLLSVHINAGGGTGFESFVYNGNYNGKEKTNQKRNIIHDEIVKAIEIRDRGKKEGNLHMVRESNMPAALTECGFIDNVSDASLLKTSSFLDKIASGHVEGLVKVFNLERINNSNDTQSASNKPVGKVRITSPDGFLNLRDKPSFKSNIIRKLQNGTEWAVFYEKNGFYNLGGEQYVSSNPNFSKFTKY